MVIPSATPPSMAASWSCTSLAPRLSACPQHLLDLGQHREVLPRRDDQHPYGAVRGRNRGVACRGLIGRRVEREAEVNETGCRPGADRSAVLTDATGEHQRVESAQAW